MSTVLATPATPVSEEDGIVSSIVDDFVNDYSITKNRAKVVKQAVAAVKDKLQDKAPANIKKIVKEYLESKYKNPNMHKSHSFYWQGKKWDADRIFKTENKEAIMQKVQELSGGTMTEEPEPDKKDKSAKSKVNFGRHYQEAARQVKERLGKEVIDGYIDRARCYNKGEVPVEVQLQRREHYLDDLHNMMVHLNDQYGISVAVLAMYRDPQSGQLSTIQHSTDPAYERLPDFWSWKDNTAHARRLDCEGWTKRQYPLSGDFDEDDEDVDMLTQPKRPRGLPMELSTGDDGRILIPVEIRNAMWEEKRDFMQTYVKMAWQKAQQNHTSPPWKSLGTAWQAYHESQYVPAGWKWSKPRDADQDLVDQLIEHWLQRQGNSEIPLEFKRVTGESTLSDKGKWVPSSRQNLSYNEVDEESTRGDSDEDSFQPRQKRKGLGNDNFSETLIQMDQEDAGCSGGEPMPPTKKPRTAAAFQQRPRPKTMSAPALAQSVSKTAPSEGQKSILTSDDEDSVPAPPKEAPAGHSPLSRLPAPESSPSPTPQLPVVRGWKSTKHVAPPPNNSEGTALVVVAGDAVVGCPSNLRFENILGEVFARTTVKPSIALSAYVSLMIKARKQMKPKTNIDADEWPRQAWWLPLQDRMVSKALPSIFHESDKAVVEFLDWLDTKPYKDQKKVKATFACEQDFVKIMIIVSMLERDIMLSIEAEKGVSAPRFVRSVLGIIHLERLHLAFAAISDVFGWKLVR